MSKPTPVLRRVGGEPRWTLDLRWADLGQYTLRTPGLQELAVEATQEAFETFFRERNAAELRSKQGSVFAGPSFRRVANQWAEEREYDTEGGARYVREYLSGLVRRFGDRAVRQFGAPQGSQVLRGWRDEMATPGPAWRSWKTRRNYLNAIMQVLAFAARAGYIEALPLKPKARVTRDADLEEFDSDWYTETDFRAVRAGLYVGSEDDLARWFRASPLARERFGRWAVGDLVEDFIARRRLYCSFGFYTGMHPFDLNRLDDRSFAADIGTFTRRNHKSARAVRPKAFEAPEALWEDVRAEADRLGRPWHKGEPICGGEWARGPVILQDTARRLGLPLPINFRSVFRRSTVHELRLRGWPEHEVADYLGHVDKRMIQEVYGRVVDRDVSRERIPWNRESTARVLSGRHVTGRAKVVPFRPLALAPDSQDEGA
jgi:integrase